MATVTRTGARLHTESLVIKRGLAQMTDEDYAVKLCPLCGARIAINSQRKYCRNGCAGIAQSRTFRSLYDAAMLANGEWVEHRFDSLSAAHRAEKNFIHMKQFDMASNGCVVSLRKAKAA